ncbi:hypothetical protein ACM46_03870 [Chryseobacterium angstadtii]|uniref:Uncharacterized protein n=1 Tax=Chryseobacterium angstadtii TaxID=558151 RepID=A0A0J7IL97_9FLAO|nr:hypothetical protein [Chryseobacterium angstadtii]KMQ66659.1 hypothetical protein ACM46_03870 [Chryseobacterium angstadtii]
METIIQHREQLQYAEVYISDMLFLKNFFLKLQNYSTLNKSFGIPFLVAKKKNEIVAFASLLINEKGEITFKIYSKNSFAETENRDFSLYAERYFKKNNTPNFRNAEQLKSSINRMVSWLNIG